MINQSVFSSLWKRKDVEEDFRTEILNFLLRILLSKNELQNFFQKLHIHVNNIKEPDIFTQSTTEAGRFDLLIKDSDTLILFENKWNSPTSLEQLIRYDNYLQNTNYKRKILIHITKDFRKINHLFRSEFYKTNWSHVYEIFSGFDDIICQEFCKFLEEEGIAMKKVSWEIIQGSKSIYSLTRVIKRACEELDITHAWKPGSADYTCQCIEDKIYVYYIFNESKLFFCIYSDEKPSDELIDMWTKAHGLYFDFDENCFFHTDLEGQVESIKSFITSFKELIDNSNISSNVEQPHDD